MYGMVKTPQWQSQPPLMSMCFRRAQGRTVLGDHLTVTEDAATTQTLNYSTCNCVAPHICVTFVLWRRKKHNTKKAINDRYSLTQPFPLLRSFVTDHPFASGITIHAPIPTAEVRVSVRRSRSTTPSARSSSIRTTSTVSIITTLRCWCSVRPSILPVSSIERERAREREMGGTIHLISARAPDPMCVHDVLF